MASELTLGGFRVIASDDRHRYDANIFRQNEKKTKLYAAG